MKELQHFVPACYLANYAFDGNKGREVHVHCMFVKDGKQSIKRVDDIALENGFYDLKELGEESRLIEGFYANHIEPQLSSLLSKILKLVELNPSSREKAYVELDKEDRNAFSAQMAIQYTRTRDYRNRFENSYNKMVEGFPWASIPKYGKKDFRRIHVMDLLELRSSNFFANLFDDRHWIFLINHTKVPFITSDNPLIQINHHSEKEMGVSPASPQATMYFPLSPKVAIEVYHKSIAKDDLRYFDVYKKETVDWYNYNEISHCTRVVISNMDFATMNYREDLHNE